jgi:hypothetical protein
MRCAPFRLAALLVSGIAGGILAQTPDPSLDGVSLAKPASATLLPIKAPPAGMNIPAFYTKYVEAEGYPIVGSERLSEARSEIRRGAQARSDASEGKAKATGAKADE